MKLQQHMYKCIEREKIEALMFPNGAVRPEIGTCYSRVYYCWDGRPWFPLGNILLLFSLFPFQTWKCLIWKILLNKRITGCFIYILDSSNSSSFTFWSSQFTCTSKSNGTSNSNGTWTDKQSTHFSTAKEIRLKNMFFFM